MKSWLGIDVGSISIKVACLVEDCEINSLQDSEYSHLPVSNGQFLLISKYRRIQGNLMLAANDLLKSLWSIISKDSVLGVSVTGSGGKILASALSSPYENEFKAIAKGAGYLFPDVTTIFEMGGLTSKFIRLERDNTSGEVGISDYEINGDCAAGTGSFIDQQATRLKISVEDIGNIVGSVSSSALIAGRCSVFAKSDMIHAQQKGAGVGEILKGLCEAVARNYKGTILKGRKPQPKVAFIGGLAKNDSVVQAVRGIFRFNDDEFIVPKDLSCYIGAIGAAFIAKEKPETKNIKISFQDSNNKINEFPIQKPLSLQDVVLLRDRTVPFQFPSHDKKVNTYLGIDIGSVSTNFAVIDEEGNLINDIYVRTEGRPIEVVSRGLNEIEKELGNKINIVGVGTTGSGRELIGELVGADCINDEITAHKTGAVHVSKQFDTGEVDTIFEIGGQDSKFISIENGIVIDFAMNEACAAGTGSFLEEQAERLGVKIEDEFAQIALSSQKPIQLGERCTVFIERDINALISRGAERKDIIAGLAYSIAINYLNRVVKGKHIGKCIFFQGGTAYNDAVAAAFSMILNKQIIVPPHNGVIGAIGMALLARDEIKKKNNKTSFRGFELSAVEYSIKEFTCRACTNYCDMQEFTVEGTKTYWGDKCTDMFRKSVKTERTPVIPDLIEFREKLFNPNITAIAAPRGKIGIPRSLHLIEMLPFWSTLFTSMGYEIALTSETNRSISQSGIELSVAEPCHPIRVGHGHVKAIFEKEIDYVLIPNVIDMDSNICGTGSIVCPWVTTFPFVIKNVPMFEHINGRFIIPTVHFKKGKEFVRDEIWQEVKKLNIKKRIYNSALDDAYDAQQEFNNQIKQKGIEALELLEKTNEPGIILLGRPYNIYDRGVNLNIPSRLRTVYGINVIPIDFLPLDGMDISDITWNMFWNYGKKMIAASKFIKDKPNLHLIYITNFKCGPDSYIKHYIQPASKKPFLTLQFDGHLNDAGFITRCEAYLKSKEVI
ncbi:MAG: acyl-CoA dehydratase activase [Bacteroidota bacterium]|nr:acyl-CoA dehydratase activase [Bacteroidota bacterium]